MKAIRVHQFGDPQVLQFVDAPDPRPGPHQALIRVRCAGVNPVETYIRSGKYGRLPPLPYTPGSDAAGEIEAVGPDVHRWKPGDRVYTSGSLTGVYAEKTLCRSNQIHPLPHAVTFEQGAAVGVPYATAWRALFQRGRAAPGESVLVHGASGGVGIAAVQIARAHGLCVIGTAGTDAGRRLVIDQGAHHVLDHRQPDYPAAILDITGNHGVHLILEMLANVNLGRDLSLLARHGRIVIIGSRGPIEINPRDAMSRDADVLGMMLFNAPETELEMVHAALVAGLERGFLQPVVGRKLLLANAAEAHRLILEPGALGKIVLQT